MNQIYQRGKYKVYRVEDGFIIHNSDKEFKDGHTHMKSMKCCRYLIQLSLEKRVPYNLSRYLLISLIRINEGEYTEKAQAVLDSKKKKQTYVNRRM